MQSTPRKGSWVQIPEIPTAGKWNGTLERGSIGRKKIENMVELELHRREMSSRMTTAAEAPISLVV